MCVAQRRRLTRDAQKRGFAEHDTPQAIAKPKSPTLGRNAGLATTRAKILGAMNRIVIGLLLGAAFVAALVYTTIAQTGVECRVCITYRGQTACETVVGPDRSLAQMQATSTACTHLSSGVTDSIRCTGTPADSVACTE